MCTVGEESPLEIVAEKVPPETASGEDLDRQREKVRCLVMSCPSAERRVESGSDMEVRLSYLIRFECASSSESGRFSEAIN